MVQACELTGDMLQRMISLFEGLQVFPERMRENLDLSGGLIMAEALMLELGKQIGRQRAHDAVYEAESAGTGSAGAVVAAPRAEPSKARKPSTYTVKRGETLTAIAQKFQCDTGDLAKVNKIKAPRFAIRPGQKLKLDACDG